MTYDLRDDLSTLRVVAFLIEHLERVDPVLAEPQIALGWVSADIATGRYALTVGGLRRNPAAAFQTSIFLSAAAPEATS